MLIAGGGINTNKDHKIRTYRPNANYRSLAVYGSSIEYDFTYKTNRLGLRETSDCGIDLRNNFSTILPIAGDSFTEGYSAKSPWVKSIDKYSCGAGIAPLNLSFGGYGLHDMLNSLKFAKSNFKTDKAIVALIENDFYRPYTPVKELDDCSTYHSEPWKQPRCGASSATWWHFDFRLNNSQIISLAKSKHKPGITELFRPVAQKLKESIFSAMDHYNKNIIVDQSIESLRKMTTIYPDRSLLLIQLPTKRTSRHGFHNKKIRKAVEELVLNNSLAYADLTQCDMRGGFLEKDDHPNQRGHSLLRDCAINDKTIFDFFATTQY